ncbi:hypothetical protein I7I53_04690 [Histoplasma capsulatum var. duboisii H88]|uniref:Uncharacterized protein n=1 Tax=Ajellomyces capsulatus (strain H88) TaxID=544711 RepID=A0A8A1LRQ6_AJEC8|nr:hypothetical protein I7I53_04690 [Histoplasma capsulatum var. duboisii H88]
MIEHAEEALLHSINNQSQFTMVKGNPVFANTRLIPPIRHPLPVALNGVLHHHRSFGAKGQLHMPLPQGVPLPIPPLTNEATNPPRSGAPPLPPPQMPKHANRPSIRLRRLRYLCHRFPYQTPNNPPADSPTDPPELQPPRIPISSSSTPSTTFSTSFSSSCTHAPGAGTTTASIACIPAGTAAARRRDQMALAPPRHGQTTKQDRVHPAALPSGEGAPCGRPHLPQPPPCGKQTRAHAWRTSIEVDHTPSIIVSISVLLKTRLTYIKCCLERMKCHLGK